MYKFIKIGFGVLVVCGLMSSCKNKVQENNINTTTSNVLKTQTVEVVKPQKRSFTAEVLVSGTVHPNQIVTLYGMQSGVLSSIRKDIGDKVYRGEIIATLNNPMLDEAVASARAELSVSKAQIHTSNADVEAIKSKYNGLQSISQRLSDVFLTTPQLTTIAEVESAKAATNEASAMVKSKKAFILAQQENVKSKEISLQSAIKQVEFLTVKAPFSGVITKRLVDKGAMIQNGMNQNNPQAIVEIQEINPVRLILPVPESDAVSIKKGMDVDISFPELSGKSYKSKISRTSGVLDPMSKTMQIEIDIDNSKGEIISGMYARAKLQINSRNNILSLPVFAKVKYKNENYVLVVDNDIVKRVPIKIGLSDKDYFEVINADITANSQVITKGKGLVKVNQKVNSILKSN
ncbi:MAG: efflux RND transporter periplasmic adaptor subunit [Saprospiraceae bacterium]